MKGQKSRSQKVKKTPKSGAMFTYVRQAPSANWAYAIVRPNLLSVPETLGCSTGRMSALADDVLPCCHRCHQHFVIVILYLFFAAS